MQNVKCQLSAGLFADVANNWLIHVVEADPRNPGVFYLGAYPMVMTARHFIRTAPLLSLSGMAINLVQGKSVNARRGSRITQLLPSSNPSTNCFTRDQNGLQVGLALDDPPSSRL